MRAGLEAFFAFLEERRGAAAIMLRNTGDPDVAEWLDRLRDGVGAAIVTLMTEEAEQLIRERPRAATGRSRWSPSSRSARSSRWPTGGASTARSRKERRDRGRDGVRLGRDGAGQLRRALERNKRGGP